MNVAYFLLPKDQVASVYADCSLRQGIEKLRNWGYSAIPVLYRDNRYVGTVSEGDFLWYLVEEQNCAGAEYHNVALHSLEKTSIQDVLRIDKNPPVKITATVEELLDRAMKQNFVPVVDDRDIFIGIITRKDILRYFYHKDLQFETNNEKVSSR